MNLALRQGNPPEDTERVFLDEIRQAAPPDQFLNLPERSAVVMVVMLVGVFVFVFMLMAALVRVFVRMFHSAVPVLMFVRVSVLEGGVLRFVVMVVFRIAIVLVMMMHVLVGFAVLVAAAAVVAVLVMGFALVDVKLHALDVLPLRAVVVHVKMADVELAQLPLKGAGFHAEVDKCADHHVAADAGDAVEVESFHAIGERVA
jgi:hypothetical protein